MTADIWEHSGVQNYTAMNRPVGIGMLSPSMCLLADLG